MTERQAATVLAALRYWQDTVAIKAREADPVASEAGAPLSDDEIDQLCELITVGEEDVRDDLDLDNWGEEEGE